MNAPEDTERLTRTETVFPVLAAAMGRGALAAVLGLLIAASAALAAPPWSAPETVSSPALFIESPHVAFDGNGRAYATWLWDGGVGQDAPTGWRVAVREPGAAEFGPERSAPNLVTAPVGYGLNSVLALDQRNRARGRITLRARLARRDGSFGRPDTIATYKPGLGPPSLSRFDVALVAWTQESSRDRRIVRVAIKRRESRFGRPVTFRARGRARHVVAAAGPGTMFVAWERAGVVEARVRLAGRGWGPVRRLGRTARGSTTFRAAFSLRRGYLAWLSESAEPAVLRVAVLPTASTRFRAAETLDTIDRSAPVEPHRPVIVPVPERDALLVWTGWDGAAWRVRGAVTGPGARFGAPFDVSPAGEQAVLGDAESIPIGTPLPAGTVMAVWSRLDAVGEVGDRVRAAVRPPGGAFGPPEDVSDLDRARLPDLAFDFMGRRWTVVWSQRIGPDQGVPLNQITTFARSSTRPG
jgi:hypothetical protein